MSSEKKMSCEKKLRRRTVCAALLGFGGTALAAGLAAAQQVRPKIRARKLVVPRRSMTPLNNADFYGADGKFNEEAAKKAYFDLMQYYRYPINDNIRNNIFVSDMALGKFTEVGLAAVILVNEQQANYAALEVFLLPNQMIPEHWHVALEDEGITAKMESWVVRYGATFTYGVGEASDPIAVKIPACQREFVTVLNERQLKPGEVTGIAKALDKHWQLAGPEGCILTEVATYHAGNAVRFSDPKIAF